MESVGSVMFHSAFAAVLVSSGLFVGCVNDDPEDKGTAGTSSGASSNTAGTSSNAGTSSGGTGSGTAGTTGAAGSVAKAPTCAMVAKASGTSPVIADFEAMTAPGSGFTFESAGIMGGTYVYSDLLAPAEDPSTSKLVLDAGYETASTKALVGQIHNATWGGGMGLWFGCMDASVYTGVTFWARGASPAGKVKLNLTVDKAVKVSEGGTCPEAGPCVRPVVELEVTEEWQQFTFAWADFTAGDSGGTALPAEVEAINGLDFGIPNDNMARELELAIDDVAFTKE
jgi:hypothetical protein